ncbi:uncharacterized protein LOC133327898 [Musca vetustissima]|uniref:uncharacterized protein LOC133327898 n=1 Tax=Musca vetustissima TaxID=27455 RepID=UPI002AB77E33|nr:uncharacterized protein LOC133327898 [Musca vetustissima]XP_061392418.1 uncharacterized protein LOC133327898 [Musca vetustissima]
MSDERAIPSKGKMKYYSSEATSKCTSCEDIGKKMDTIPQILGEHKILLDRIGSQNSIVQNIMAIFPINTDESLKQLEDLLATQSDPYIRQMKNLIGGNVARNLHLVFGKSIIMNYNVDGTFGKKSLSKYGKVHAAIIDVISTYDKCADKALRTAFQRQKKKFFKENSRRNAEINDKTKENEFN